MSACASTTEFNDSPPHTRTCATPRAVLLLPPRLAALPPARHRGCCCAPAVDPAGTTKAWPCCWQPVVAARPRQQHTPMLLQGRILLVLARFPSAARAAPPPMPSIPSAAWPPQ